MKTATTATPAEYVQAHLPILTAYSYSRRFRPWHVEPDDFCADLVAAVLRSHHTFRVIEDPKINVCSHCGRRGCATWLGWRARKIASIHHRQRLRDEAMVQRMVPIEEAADAIAADGSPRRMFARAQVQQMMERATPAQRDALRSKLEDWSGDEVWSRLGISIGGRNYRLRSLMQTLTEERTP